MTEYDYSPEAYERALATQNRIAKWVDTTERHRDEFQTPFGPGGLHQQQRPPLESHSSRSTPTPSRHRDRQARRSSRHHGGYESSDSGSNDSREYGPGPGPMPRGLQPATGYPGPHQHQQQYQPMQMQQQYASPHVQIYGAPVAPGQMQIYGGAAPQSLAPAPAPGPAIGGGARPPMLALPPQHLPQHQMQASYSYAGAGSPPLYGYPGYPMAVSPPLVVSAGHSSPRKSSKSKSKRSRSHQPTPTSAAAGAALAMYYSGYASPPHTPGYQYAYPHGGMSSPAATGGGSITGGYFVPQQYPPMVPMMVRPPFQSIPRQRG